jgi:hypothetical protein
MKLGQVCNHCGLTCTKNLATKDQDGKRTGFADPCLGILPGVKYGCCGHGEYEGYLFFENGRTIRFDLVLTEQQLVNIHHRFNDRIITPRK